MTRINVFHEGVEEFPDGRLVGVGALKLPDTLKDGEPLPVVVNFVHNMIVGRADDMRRDEDGQVSFEVAWLNPRFEKIYSDMAVTVYASPIQAEFNGKRSLVTSATVRAVSFFDATSADMGRSLPV